MNLPLEKIVIRRDVLAGFKLAYDRKYDTLFVRPEPPQSAISVAVTDQAWLRIDPDTLELVGVEIEDFARVFLENHPELLGGWEEWKLGGRSSGRPNGPTAFLHLLGDLLEQAFEQELQESRSRAG